MNLGKVNAIIKNELFFLILSGIVAVSSAADTIYFKNGTRLDIERTWEEGEKIKCIMFGNEYEYEKDKVERIERNGSIIKLDNNTIPKKEDTKEKQQATELRRSAEELSLEYHQKALSFAEEENWKKAIQNEQQAYLLNSKEETIKKALSYFYTMYAMDFYQKGNLDDTLRYCNEALEIIPEYKLAKEGVSYVYVARARGAYDQRDFDTAESYLKEASHYDADNPNIYILYGKIAYDKDQFEEAKEEWLKALDIDPGLDEVKVLLKRFSQEHRIEEDFEKTNAGNFSIKFEGPEKKEIADQAVRILNKAYLDVGNELGEYPKHVIEVIIYPERDIKELDYYPDMAAGLYDGKIRFSERLISDSNYFKAVLYHEYTHVIVHIKGGRNVPIWLNEGLAEYCSRQYKTTSHKNSRKSLLRAAAKKNALIPFRQLSMTSLAGLKRLTYPLIALLYAQSDSFVTYMVKKFTINDMQTILEYIGNGESAKTAIMNTINYSLEDLETEWKESLLQ